MPKTNGSGQATTLSPEQLECLVNGAPSPAHRCLWSIMRFTGSRVSETLKLTWGAIHSDRIVFVRATTKTRTTREPRISPALAAELRSWRHEWSKRYECDPRPRDLVFPGRFNLKEPMTRQAADKALRSVLDRLGLPSGCSLHTPRRSLATSMAQNGVSLPTIARFTGHASLQQLQTYIDVDPTDELAALAAIGG